MARRISLHCNPHRQPRGSSGVGQHYDKLDPSTPPGPKGLIPAACLLRLGQYVCKDIFVYAFVRYCSDERRNGTCLRFPHHLHIHHRRRRSRHYEYHFRVDHITAQSIPHHCRRARFRMEAFLTQGKPSKRLHAPLVVRVPGSRCISAGLSTATNPSWNPLRISSKF